MKNLLRILSVVTCILIGIGSSAICNANPIGPNTPTYIFDPSGAAFSTAHHLEAGRFTKNAGIVPNMFPDTSASIFSSRFNRNHFMLASILLSLTLLVLAHKNHFETDIYEFYNRDQDGTITFDSVEAQNAHFIRAALAKILRLGGILCAAAAIIAVVFA